MKKLSFKAVFVPAISLFLICITIAFLLGLTNELTKNAIEENAILKEQKAMEAVCSYGESFEKETSVSEEMGEVYRALDENGNTTGYAISVTEKGYGGDISVMVGISSKGEVTGVEILSINETPGLGMNATKEEFRSQFKGIPPMDGFTAKDSAERNKNVDALTGATITSEAVSSAVNKAVDIYQIIKEAGH